ncbi:MAG TPA: MFS transporter [Steroidobacteraceae bacterium]|jgi:MFS family permease
MKPVARALVIVWLMMAMSYFYQYLMRSAPGAMLAQLAEGFGLTTLGVTAMAGMFYFGYSPFSLVAGVALDRFGAREIVPIGAIGIGLGALLFASGDNEIASIGRILQGAGGVIALVSAVHIVTTRFPAARMATLVGVTQTFGVTGLLASQFLVSPSIIGGIPWRAFWIIAGLGGVMIGVILFLLLQKCDWSAQAAPLGRSEDWLKNAGQALGTVFRNPQSILCGMIAGLLFIPTTIFDLIWGVRYLQEAHGFDYATAVMHSTTVPLGWIIGCPLLGAISDRLGRRKPVILSGAVVLLICLAWILHGPPDALPPYVLGLIAGIASGAAILPYTVITEVNPPQLSATAIGAVNFMNFTFSALLGPVFGAILSLLEGGPGRFSLENYQTAFAPLPYGVGLAILLTLLLKETGPAIRARSPAAVDAQA